MSGLVIQALRYLGKTQHHGRPRETIAQAPVTKRPAAVAGRGDFAVRPGVDAPASAHHRREGVTAMSAFAALSVKERAAFVREASARLDVQPVDR